MSFPKESAGATALFDELFPEDAGVTRKPMFGHTAAFVNGHMFMGTFGEDVILRLDEGARAELLKKRGTKVFMPMEGRPMKEYVVVPRAWRDDLETARAWAARSLTWARSLAPKQIKAKVRLKKIR